MNEVRESEKKKFLRRSDENRPDEVTGESRLFQDSALSGWCSYSVTIVLLLLNISTSGYARNICYQSGSIAQSRGHLYGYLYCPSDYGEALLPAPIADT